MLGPLHSRASGLVNTPLSRALPSPIEPGDNDVENVAGAHDRPPDDGPPSAGDSPHNASADQGSRLLIRYRPCPPSHCARSARLNGLTGLPVDRGADGASSLLHTPAQHRGWAHYRVLHARERRRARVPPTMSRAAGGSAGQLPIASVAADAGVTGRAMTLIVGSLYGLAGDVRKRQ